MSLSTWGDALLILLLIGWFGYRQTTWRPVAIDRMWRVPAIMGLIGAGELVQQTGTLSAADLALIIVELAISLAVGAWMGSLAHLRPLAGAAAGPGRPTFESRTGAVGLVLWLLVIGLRVGIDAAGAHWGVVATTSTAAILLSLAANRLGRAAVLASRVDRAGRARMMVR